MHSVLGNQHQHLSGISVLQEDTRFCAERVDDTGEYNTGNPFGPIFLRIRSTVRSLSFSNNNNNNNNNIPPASCCDRDTLAYHCEYMETHHPFIGQVAGGRAA